MLNSKKLRWAILATSVWAMVCVVFPIALCLGLQQPQTIPFVIGGVHIVIFFAAGMAFGIIKLITWAEKGK